MTIKPIRESLIARKKLSTDDILNNNDNGYGIKSTMESLITVPEDRVLNIRMKNSNKKEWLTIYPPNTKENKSDYVVIYIEKEYTKNTRSSKTIENLIDINIDRWNSLDFPKKIAFTNIKSFNKKMEFNDKLSIIFNGFKKCDLSGFEFYSNSKSSEPLSWVINGDNQTIKNCKFEGNKMHRMFLLDGSQPISFNSCSLSVPKTMYFIIENEVDYQFNIIKNYNKVQQIIDPNTVKMSKSTYNMECYYGILKDNNVNYIDNLKYTDEVYGKKWALQDEFKDIYIKNNINIKGSFIINHKK